MPDTYFRNSVMGGIAKLFADNFYFRITDKNLVFMAARVQMKLNCDMDFIKFPFDSQTCFINITTREFEKVSLAILSVKALIFSLYIENDLS